MRTQAGLEFLLVLSLIGVLGFAAIVEFGQQESQYNKSVSLFADPGNDLQQNLSYSFQKGGLMAYAEDSEGSGMLKVALFGCSNGAAELNFTSKTAILGYGYRNLSFSGLTLLNVSFVTTSESGNIAINYTILCSGKGFSGVDIVPFVSGSPSYSNQSASAFITDRNESVAYALIDNYSLGGYSIASHCSVNNMWGDPDGVKQQCGTLNAWDYLVFSPYCYYDEGGNQNMAFCIDPQQTAPYLLAISQAPEYRYSFRLEIDTGAGEVYANMSSGASSGMYLDGKEVGNATVSSAYASPMSVPGALLEDGGEYYSVESSSLDNYVQALNSLESTLGFYNSTEVDGDEQQQINQSLSFVELQQARILNSSMPFSSACTISEGYYSCGGAGPFSYSINVTLQKTAGIGNLTLDYIGSTITVHSE